jgi:hypothetical protein
MREPKAEWVTALRAECGSQADIYWNHLVGRWSFKLPSADGVPREQFWGQFFRPGTTERLPLDPVTGLPPFRDLDDDAMREALANLQRSYIGNPFDGAGTTRREVYRRYAENREMKRNRYIECGNRFADMAADRGRKIRVEQQVNVPIQIVDRKPPRSREVITPTPHGA